MKVFILGIDSAEPDLVFGEWRKELPTISQLMEEGAWGKISSTVPPITCPAWPSAFSGCNPGRFGLYDLRYRKLGTYTEFGIVNSRVVKVPRLWNILSKHGMKSVVAFVPVTYPPEPINGFMVTSFLTPSVRSPFTYPPQLKREVLRVVGGPSEYIIDVYDYRRKDPKELYEELRAKTEHDFKVIKYLLKNKPWDLFTAIIMSIDRAQHTLWKYFDKEHPRFVEDPELKDGLLNLHKQIDEELSEILEQLPKDTLVIILSDHGAKRMYYRINVNEILVNEGILKLKKRPRLVTGLRELDKRGVIDWSKTSAYALGAYIAQVFVNLKGREPKGVVRPGEEYESVREQIADILRNVKGPNGESLNTKVFFKEEVYKGEMLDVMPDLTVYFDNLHYGANEAVGFNSPYSLETIKGPDDSNHGEFGIFIIRDPENRTKGQLKGLKLEDVTPTVLEIMGTKGLSKFDGTSLI